MDTERYSIGDKVRVIKEVPNTNVKVGMTGTLVVSRNNGDLAFDYAMKVDGDIYLVNTDEIERYFTLFPRR
jgi:hypothetical protein